MSDAVRRDSPVSVKLGERSYEVHIGAGVLREAGELVAAAAGGRGVIVTHPAIQRLHGETLRQGLHPLAFDPILVPAGERQKSRRRAERLWDDLLARGADRKSVVIGFGGGVIGDLAGFVAATYMRGVPYVQVPTTLLAQVDASVGGKVAINHPKAKNLIGCFYQPQVVISDVSVLATLPARDYRAGLAEVVKAAVIADHAFFAWLEGHIEDLAQRDPGALVHVVRRCCEVKAEVVARDEREAGPREALNFGHTVGHALEAIEGYHARRHGEAVAIGMAVAARIAESLGLLSLEEEARLVGLLEKMGLPTRIPGVAASLLVAALRSDKKAIGGVPRFSLPAGLGRVEPGYEVETGALERLLVEMGAGG